MRRWLGALAIWTVASVGAASPPTWTTTYLTINSVDDRLPLVDGRYVAWHGVAPGTTTFHIFATDLLTGGTQDAGINGPYFISRRFDLQGSDLVYFDTNGYVIHYDIGTGVTTNLTPTATGNLLPKVAKRKVVWYSGAGAFLHDLDTHLTTPLTAAYTAPVTDGSYVAWGNGGVFLYDIAHGGTTPITSDPSRTFNVYALDAGRILWVSSNNSASDDNNIEVYRISSGETAHVALGIPDADVADAKIAGDNVIWSTGSPPTCQIQQFDLASGVATPVSTAGQDAYNPAVSETGVAYTQDHGDGTRDIVYFDTASHAYTTLTDAQGAPRSTCTARWSCGRASAPSARASSASSSGAGGTTPTHCRVLSTTARTRRTRARRTRTPTRSATPASAAISTATGSRMRRTRRCCAARSRVSRRRPLQRSAA